MTLGALLAGVNDLEFSFVGYFWMIMNCLSTSGYVLYMRYASSTIQLPKFGMVYYNNVLSILILLPIMFLRHEYKSFVDPVYWNIQFLIINILAGILGFYLNFASLWCVSSTSATTYAIVGSVNKVPITILGFFLFKAKMTIEGTIFVTFATFGGFLYAYSKLPK
jgi:GDP-mannose transporter